ncbi:MAG TPA: TraR/DksA family transcriptional regulator [Mycobacteriales bacterium]|nr:TraR/DksA family transcriptional regulator [Mycobacteriales bacterium]
MRRTSEVDAELTRRRDELVAQIARLNAPREEGMAAIGFGKRAGDFTAIATEQEERAMTAEQLDQQLDVVLRALAKVADGSYGRCDDCGGPIGEARLDALPTAVRCVSCQSNSRNDARPARRGRRH